MACLGSYLPPKIPTLLKRCWGWNDPTFLNKAKLCIRDKITRTAILLLGKSESEHFLHPGLSLGEIMLLDKVQKHTPLEDTEIKRLKNKKLIEGRKPNFHISSQVAGKTGQKTDYMKMRGIDDDYCKKIIVDYLRKFGQGKKADFEKILLDKLPDVLSEKQKQDRLRYILQKLRKSHIVKVIDRRWCLVETK